MPIHPPIDPYETGFLPVDEIHSLYYELSGNPFGEPILFLHGGPGSRTDPKHRQFFDPKRYKIILFDQRGSGKSIPYASIEKNTTWDLVNDMERLRAHLQVEKWALFGGSWGSTLALIYSITHPQKVQKMVLRGIFLATKPESDWFYQVGARHFYPTQWDEFCSFIPENERANIIGAYYKRLRAEDPKIVEEAAKRWSTWELTCVSLSYDAEAIKEFVNTSPPIAIARIETHYFMHDFFLPQDDWIIQNAPKLEGIPIHIVQGRYDLLCPPLNAYRLLKAHPSTTLRIIQQGGHSSSDPMMIEALVAACHL